MLYINNYKIDINNKDYYIIYKNDIEFMKINKKRNSLEDVKKLLGVQEK